MSVPGVEERNLRIIHVLRAPMGGLFRHVMDLTREQIARGHEVGLIADSLTGGNREQEALDDIAGSLKLGVKRVPMQRKPAPGDLRNLYEISRWIGQTSPDVVHGHGSKGGLYARMSKLFHPSAKIIRAYTPHGGSFNYNPGSTLHSVYMTTERALDLCTDIYLFESAYIQSCFEQYVGKTARLNRVVLNGIRDSEFNPVTPDEGAADFLYIGELRSIKGIDTFVDALALARDNSGRRQTAVLIGTGPDRDALMQQSRLRGLSADLHFPGAMAAQDAFKLGRIMVVPSRAESLPYVVLEAAGASVPMVATNVGGIPEIFGPFASRLIPSNDTQRLAEAMIQMQGLPGHVRALQAARLQEFVRGRFHISAMAGAVINGYRDALREKTQPGQSAHRALAASS